MLPVLLQLSPSEGEEDEGLRHRESSDPARQEDSKPQTPGADQDKATANATPATPPSTNGDTEIGRASCRERVYDDV